MKTIIFNFNFIIMEKFKLDIYEKENGHSLSGFNALEVNRRNESMNYLYKIVGISGETKDLFFDLESKLISKDFEEDFTHDIDAIFKEFGFSLNEKLIIIWNRNNFDEFDANVLINEWNYIWYGSSDEAIILFQEGMKKILLITHYGRIYYN